MVCVSAQDCHYIEGRLEHEAKGAVFSELEDTGVPFLRQHVHALTGRPQPTHSTLADWCEQLTCHVAGQHTCRCCDQLQCRTAVCIAPGIALLAADA